MPGAPPAPRRPPHRGPSPSTPRWRGRARSALSDLCGWPERSRRSCISEIVSPMGLNPTRPRSAHLEAPVRGEWRSLDHLGQVLVEEDAGDQLLARGDAELLEEALDVVADRVGREDEGLGDLRVAEPACDQRRHLALARG